MESVYYVVSKMSAGEGYVNVVFNEIAETTTNGVGSSFSKTLAQADADQYEVNSLWQQTLVPYVTNPEPSV